MRFDHKQRRWLIWDDRRKRWTEDKECKVRALMKATARKRYRAALGITGDERRKRESFWALQSESRYHIDAALDLAQSESPISDSGERWDGNPWLFGAQNGVIDLHTGEMRAEQIQDYITKRSPVRFDPRAKCPRFELFLVEIFGGDKGLIRYVQKAGGYSLTGSTQEQCLFPCFGDGANGKTTFVEVLGYIAGDYGADLPFHALEVKRGGGVPNESILLLGRRFVKSAETREGRHLDEARVKAWTGGDAMIGRPLYKEYFTFSPTHKLWLSFNHKPIITDTSGAMWRRIRLIPFLHKFEGRQADNGLLEKLKAEASGILNWLIEGCLAWQKDGLGCPEAIERATREYQQESDSLRPFLDDCCTFDSTKFIFSADLWKAYMDWANRNGEAPLSRTAFADRLKRRGLVPDEVGHDKRRAWWGLCFRPEQSDAGTRAGAGADSQNFSYGSIVGEVSGNGHPHTPAGHRGIENDGVRDRGAGSSATGA